MRKNGEPEVGVAAPSRFDASRPRPAMVMGGRACQAKGVRAIRATKPPSLPILRDAAHVVGVLTADAHGAALNRSQMLDEGARGARRSRRGETASGVDPPATRADGERCSIRESMRHGRARALHQRDTEICDGGSNDTRC